MNRRLAFLALHLALIAALAPLPASARDESAARASGSAEVRSESLSSDVRHIADWAVHSGDHRRLPFIVVDKVNAKAVAFDAAGRLLRSAPVLIGMGVGDRFAPGVAELDMYKTQPWQRVTPAGRFFAEEGENLDRERVLWVDYDSGIAMHKLPRKHTKQRRHERIRSPDPAEHRITYGCINVPPAFYDQVVHPQFKAKGGIVYVLPDSTSPQVVFKSYDVNVRPAAAMPTRAQRSPAVVTERF